MKRIYTFGNRQAEGSKDQKGLLGGKGANLAEMVNIGLPVPPGFTNTTVRAKNTMTTSKPYLHDTWKK